VTAAAGYKKGVDPLSQNIFISSISQYFISRFLKIALVLVRFDHSARFIENANQRLV
jgi:hypothetical protein